MSSVIILLGDSMSVSIKTLENNRFSILTNDLAHCYLCGRPKNHLHEVFFGKNRVNSMKWGCVVPLCAFCHTKVHSKVELDLKLKKLTQKAFNEVYEGVDFLSIFHKNYL